MKKRIIPIVVSILLLGGIIYTSDAFKVFSTISKVNIYMVLIILFIWYVALLLRSLRWWTLLKKSDIKVPFFSVMKIYIPGLFLSALSPGKIGDPVRSFLFKQTNNISIGKSISSILVERIFDVICVVFLAMLFIPLLPQFSSFRVWFILSISVYIFCVSFVIFLFSSNLRTKKFIRLFYTIFSFISLVRKSKIKIDNFALTLSQSFSKFFGVKILLSTFLLTLIIWIMEGFVVYFAVSSIGFKIPVLLSIATMAISTLIGVLSFLPSGIGSSELVFILIITNTLPLTVAQATSAALIGRIPFLIYAVLGAIILSLLKYRYKILD